MTTRTIKSTTRQTLALSLALTALASLVACEKPAPPSASSQKPSAPLSGLSDNPQSLLGKSAAAGKNTAKQIEQSQAATGAMAAQFSGETTLLTVSSVEFRHPSAWQKSPPANSMQKAALQVAPDSGEGPTICVWLPNIGGDTASNVQRWKGMVTNPDTGSPAEAAVETRTISGMKVTTVAMSGTYASMTSGSSKPLPGQGFRGAIIEAPSGSIFVRMTGPKEQVDAASAAWDQMILAIRKP